MIIRTALILACAALLRGEGLPLPDAPLRLVIPDVRAFDKALSGPYRQFLEGSLSQNDPMLAAWKRTRLGSKLDSQWAAFSDKVSLDWRTLKVMQPSSVGLALLDAGHLEAVLIIETPLSLASLSLPKGAMKNHNGVSYTLIAEGAADDSGDKHERMGFAWAGMGNKLIFASSERAMKLALDAALSNISYTIPLEGLACLDLNLDELRRDIYFKREFPFPKGTETGRLYAALRRQGGNLVEVRQGTGESRSPVFKFEADNAAIAGWEPDGGNFWPTFRRALLDTEPNPSSKPVPALRPLPSTAGALDSYLVDFTKPATGRGSEAWEEGDLTTWTSLLADVSSYGYSSHRAGQRILVFPWPKAKDAPFMDACLASMARRHGMVSVARIGDIQEIQAGPGLPVLAVRRTGAFLWVAARADHLSRVTEPQPESALIRWAKLDLNAVRAEESRWNKIEGPSAPEYDRPLSDRLLGLLGWMPNAARISVERRKTTDNGWIEKVVFGGGD